MTYSHMSTKYQIVIPKEIRRGLNFEPGQRFLVLHKDGIIQLIPDIPTKKLRGLMKKTSLNSHNIRNKSDRP